MNALFVLWKFLFLSFSIREWHLNGVWLGLEQIKIWPPFVRCPNSYGTQQSAHLWPRSTKVKMIFFILFDTRNIIKQDTFIFRKRGQVFLKIQKAQKCNVWCDKNTVYCTSIFVFTLRYLYTVQYFGICVILYSMFRKEYPYFIPVSCHWRRSVSTFPPETN
jgi:hypothetical protein